MAVLHDSRRHGGTEFRQVNDICYTVKTDAYAQERLKLDVYYPEGKIARSIIGESPAFYTYLDELFQ